jgi:hypothetical protein
LAKKIEVVYPTDEGKMISRRDKIVKDANNWQKKVQPSLEMNGVSTPTEAYLVVSGLLSLVFSLETQLERLKVKR